MNSIYHNLSLFSNNDTASTNYQCALQRAENLKILGASKVLELCVGPSLAILEKAYSQYQLSVVGNDIDPRWQNFYPKGKWIIGDATQINSDRFDTVVIAPPLSRGCSGRRKDSLSLDEVVPNYNQFLHLPNKIITFVLPGKTLSLKADRKKLFKFMSILQQRSNRQIELCPLRNKITKYLDLYWIKT